MNTGYSTLAEALDPYAVSFDVLRQRNRPLLAVTDKLLGVVPNSHRYLAIWPTGFRTCNLLVPTFLNMPSLVLGAGEQKKLVGLVMYASSRAAQCAYCSAHSCSFALRRGASEPAIAHALDSQSIDSGFGARQRAALGVADAVGRLPDSLTAAQRDEFLHRFSDSEVERLVLAIALMGFLNKFMDATGMPLEDAPLHEATRILAPTGWNPGKHHSGSVESRPEGRSGRVGDSLRTKLGLVPLMPSLIARELRWTAGVPSRWPEVGHYLKERSGLDLPVLSKLSSRRAVRALAAVVRDNTDPAVTELGLPAKFLAGIVYANVAQHEQLLRAVDLLAGGAGVTSAQRSGALDGLDLAAVTALQLAEAASHSPAQITPEIIDHAEQTLSPPAIVELMVWISLLQLLHRLHVFYSYPLTHADGVRR